MEDNKNIIGNIEFKKGSKNLFYAVESSINAVNISDRKERLYYIYNESCKYLDREVVEKNICGFMNDKCSAKRNTNCTMGCCHHFPHKKIGIFLNEKLELCEYQKDKRCTANCIACKMFMCPEKEKEGYRYNVFNVPLINVFFNIIQKTILATTFFTPEDEIMKKVLRF